jgi:hypothetical protein
MQGPSYSNVYRDLQGGGERASEGVCSIKGCIICTHPLMVKTRSLHDKNMIVKYHKHHACET